MDKLYSTMEVAEQLEVTRTAINYYNYKFGYGRKIGGRLVFTERDIKEIRQIMEGNR